MQDIAKQIAACPNVIYVKTDEIPQDFVDREKAIAMGSDTLKGKPENIKEQIVQGKLDKTLKELCLLYQPYIKDQSITVEELIKQAISKLGENIQIRRFSRFVLGEGIEKPVSNLADEVAAQTGAKSAVIETVEEAAPSAPANAAEQPEKAKGFDKPGKSGKGKKK